MARLTVEQRRIARRMHFDGYSLREIGAEIGCSHEAVRLVLGAEPIYRVPREWDPGPGRLTLGHREEISVGLQRGETFTAIAGRLGRAVSTVSREVAANGGRSGYRAWRAHRRAAAPTRKRRSFSASASLSRSLAPGLWTVSDSPWLLHAALEPTDDTVGELAGHLD